MENFSAKAIWKLIYNPRPNIHPILYWIGMCLVAVGYFFVILIFAILIKVAYIVVLQYVT